MTEDENRSQKDLDKFYDLIEQLKQNNCEPIRLSECDSKIIRSKQGVYFFFDDEEFRKDKKTPRIVRVGTHALIEGQKSTLWGRLRTHKGYSKKPEGGGNHRRSVFRKLVGSALMKNSALMEKYHLDKSDSWGIKSENGDKETTPPRKNEKPIEKCVSTYIGNLKVLWVEVKEANYRKCIESNAIRLLSKCQDKSLNENWLGKDSSDDVKESALWNSKDIKKQYHPEFWKSSIQKSKP